MNNLLSKETVMLEHYRSILENRTFDEYDILGFLIFIRCDLDKEFQYIKEFADLVAHRQRDRGVAMTAIVTAIKNNYKQEPNKKNIKGYAGIHTEDWRNEWKKFLSSKKIKFSEELLLDLTMCIYSLAQNTLYSTKDGNEKYNGKIELFQDHNGNLNLCTIETQPQSPYICFAQIGPYKYKKIFPSTHIEETVETFRENGVLHLRTVSGDILI